MIDEPLRDRALRHTARTLMQPRSQHVEGHRQGKVVATATGFVRSRDRDTFPAPNATLVRLGHDASSIA
ncbi:MAG: hypothetical protein IPM29_28550 [Planctomycetes bacterium]|nr:hypothetical protein [Planctomycetota bacterium]